MKKLKVVLLGMFLLLLPTMVNAKPLKVGTNEYDSIDDALAQAKLTGDEILLQENLVLDLNNLQMSALSVNIGLGETITINLNNKQISGNWILRNSGILTIKNGSLLTTELSGGNFIENAAASILDITDVEVKQFENNSGAIIKNDGVVTLKRFKAVKSDTMSSSVHLLNNAQGSMNIEDCELSAQYNIIKNAGEMGIKGGTYTTYGNTTVNENTGILAIDGGTFEAKGNSFIFETKENGHILVNTGTFKGYSSFKSDCAAGKTCSVIINNGKFENTKDIFVVTGGNGNITVANGDFTTTANDYLFHGTGGDGKITILNGKFKAASAKNISDFGQGKLEIVLGKKDNKAAEVPYIEMPNGDVTLTKNQGSKLYFYDGILIMKKNSDNVIKGVNDAVPEDGYKVCYTKYSDTALKAQLKTACDTTIDDELANEEKADTPIPGEDNNKNTKTEETKTEETKAEVSKKETVDNPKTGQFISRLLVLVLSGIAIGILLYTKKKNKFNRI